MPRLGLWINISSLTTRISQVIKSFWEDKFDLWEAYGNVWEQEN